ncbi:MAG: hypothetical protein ACWGP1_05710 [Syntrophobacteria bacterium]
MNGMTVDIFCHMIIDTFTIFINPAKELIFVAHEAVVLVSRFSIRAY